ncbi:acyltransferase family protein [Nocardioides sp.]|uniref:acyltransferase family protein n=1 Tax=Nocardioides sp. TaxID=35761 RepID=UPI003527548C
MDVFFVVSGFLITSLLLREVERTGRVRIGDFYARRARRILPAATVALVATVVASALLLPLTRSLRVAGDAAWAALFAGNVHAARTGTDYFSAEAAPSPLQHFWSLGVEEQFYLVWPLLVAALVALTAVAGAARVRRLVLAGALALVVVVSFAWSVHLVETAPTAAYFSAPARAWELAVGALLAVLAGRASAVPAAARGTLAGLALAAVLGSALLLGHDTPFPGWAALLPVVGTAVLLAVGIPEPAGPARLLAIDPMVWLGDRSYSLYLWHWPVLLLGAPLLDLPTLPRTALLVGAATALSELSFRLVEAPFRTGRWWRPPRRSLALWPVALACTLTAVLAVHAQAGRVTDRLAAASSGFDPRAVPAAERTARTGNRVHDLIADALDRAEVAAPIPFPVENDLTDLDHDRPEYGADCVADDAEVGHDLCPLGTVGAAQRVVVVGDSHAYMWLPALDRLGRRGGFEVVPLVKFSCTPYDLPMRTGPDGPAFPECQAQHDWARQQIATLDPELVLVASRDYPDELLTEPGTAATWRSAVRAFAAETHALGPQVQVLGDVSTVSDPAGCLLADGATMADCTGRMDPHVRAVNRAVEAGARAAGARYVDVNRLVCVRGRCLRRRPGGDLPRRPARQPHLGAPRGRRAGSDAAPGSAAELRRRPGPDHPRGGFPRGWAGWVA